MFSASGERCETDRQATTHALRDGTYRGELEQSCEGQRSETPGQLA